MKINLEFIKARLLSGDEVAVNTSHLKDDMESLFNYYLIDEDRPPIISLYFSERSTFDLTSFSETYFTNIIGSKVSYSALNDVSILTCKKSIQ